MMRHLPIFVLASSSLFALACEKAPPEPSQNESAKTEGTAKAAQLNAEALKVQGAGLVIAREWIERWDGKLPNVYSSGGGGGMIFELVADIPGEFPFVNHAFGHGQKGAIGFLETASFLPPPAGEGARQGGRGGGRFSCPPVRSIVRGHSVWPMRGRQHFDSNGI